MASKTGAARWPAPALACLLIGLLGAGPLVLITPPFQVPDEVQHFDRAYQLSEGVLLGTGQDGRHGGMLPSSLPVLARRFLGINTDAEGHPITRQPLAQTWRALSLPLDPAKREFVEFNGVGAYAPLAYLPQALAIAIGRAAGAGPLALLWLARAANALVAIALVSVAVGLMPVGQVPALLFGLLPMALYEYASVSPDALVISGSFLLAALGLRALVRGSWRWGEVLAAAVAGAVVCSIKPVYAPLLVIALPAALVAARRRHHLQALAIILAVALGTTAAWFAFAAGHIIGDRHGSIPTDQLGFMGADPLRFLKVIAVTIRLRAAAYVYAAIGVLGWLTLWLPGFVYQAVAIGLVAACVTRRADAPRLPLLSLVWCLLLFVGGAGLVMTAMYLVWTPVGGWMVHGVQGRYLLPLLPLIAAILGSLPAWRAGPRMSAIQLAVVAGIALLNAVTVVLTVGHAYAVF